MRQRLLAFLLPHILDSLIDKFSLTTVKYWVDLAIDKIEDHILETDNQIDDILLPYIYSLRTLLDVPDNPLAVSHKKA
jgi:hypothetical protein